MSVTPTGAASPTTAAAGADTVAARLRVRYFAGAAAAAGREEEDVDLAPSATGDDLVSALAALHPPLAPVLAVASLLVDEVAVGDRSAPLAGARQVDVLPPFAGG